MIKFIIPKMIGLNEYINACRGNYYHANNLKKQAETVIMSCIERDIPEFKTDNPIIIHYTYYDNGRRDLDNISATTHKFVQDALVKFGIIQDDNPKHVIGFIDTFIKENKDQRIEVEILEVGD